MDEIFLDSEPHFSSDNSKIVSVTGNESDETSVQIYKIENNNFKLLYEDKWSEEKNGKYL